MLIHWRARDDNTSAAAASTGMTIGVDNCTTVTSITITMLNNG